MAIVRELIARFSIKTDRKSVDQAESAISKISNNMKALAAGFAVFKVSGALKGAIEDIRALGDSTAKTASKLGINAEALQELRFAAEQSGVSVQAFDVGLQRLVRRAAETAKGVGVAKKSFKQLGIEVTQNGQLKPAAQLIREVADALDKIPDAGERVRVAMSLVDTEGVALVNTFKGGSKGLDEQGRILRATGAVMDADFRKVTSDLTDEQNILRKTLLGVNIAISRKVIPVMQAISKSTRAFIKENSTFFRQTLPSALKLIVQLVQEMARVGFVMAGAIRNIGGLIGEMTKLKAVLLSVGAAAVFFFAPFLVGPALTLGGLAAMFIVLQDIANFMAGKDSITGRIKKNFAKDFPGLTASLIAFRDIVLDLFNMELLEDRLSRLRFLITDNVIDPIVNGLGSINKKIKALIDKLPPVIKEGLGFGIAKGSSTGKLLLIFFDNLLKEGVNIVNKKFKERNPATSSIVNQPNTVVNTTINASSSATPTSIANESAKVMRAEAQRQNRAAAQALLPAFQGAGF